MKDLFAIAEQFVRQGHVLDIRELGNGNINDTFLATLDTGAGTHFVLQRINTDVFVNPGLVMQNILIATEHMRSRMESRASCDCRRWEVPKVLRTRDGRDHLIGPDGAFWRGISFMEGCRSFDTIIDSRHAGEVGYALGRFHALLSDLPPERLADTLEGFHITPLYLRHYAEVLAVRPAAGSVEERYCAKFVQDRAEWADVLEKAKKRGELGIRPVHGDPKIDNIMIDDSTGLAVGIVDLDTVKPGIVHYDVGDCLRSACNPPGEEPGEGESVRFDTDICRAVLRGYLTEAKRFLTGHDFSYFFDAVRLITFELGLRFYTDHLEGDIYFKVKRPGHNLSRALAQFRLAESIESQEAAIRAMIRDLQ
jgi:Ser/Thr protein kinase RdoA (MazF antagonist)